MIPLSAHSGRVDVGKRYSLELRQTLALPHNLLQQMRRSEAAKCSKVAYLEEYQPCDVVFHQIMKQLCSSDIHKTTKESRCRLILFSISRSLASHIFRLSLKGETVALISDVVGTSGELTGAV